MCPDKILYDTESKGLFAMCGRFTLSIRRERFEAVYSVQAPLEFVPRYNIAPTQNVPIVRAKDTGLESAMVRWGITNSKTNKPIINARAETVAELPTFASSLRERRCLVPATGWYEWRNLDGKKQPYHLSTEDGELGLAGVWRTRDEREEFSIITTTANESIDHIHDRMPVILPRERWRVWLADTPLEEVVAMLEPYPAKRMDAWAVGNRVGSVKNDDEDLLEGLF
jgi:putative SOS response-associated peptidase YedK